MTTEKNDQTEPQKPEEIPEKPPEEPTEKPVEEPQSVKEKQPPVDRGESYWTPKELASKLGCGRTWVYEQINDGKIKAIRQGRSVKISPEEAERVLKEGLPLPPKPEPPMEITEVVVDEKQSQKLKPPEEPKVEPDEDTGSPGWPLSIFFR